MFRHALRRLRRSPAHSLGALLTLGLGLGAACATIQVAEAFYLRALPFRQPDELVRVFVRAKAGGPLLSPRAESLLAIQERTGAIFTGLVGQRLTSRTLRTATGAEGVDTVGVTAGWADLLGVEPQTGRLFSPAEAAAGESAGVALLSDGAWKSLFGGDPGIVGRVVTLDGQPVEIIGVLPRGYAFPYSADLWHPTRADRPSASNWAFNAPARLAPGVSLAAANAALAAAAPELERLLPAAQAGMVPVAVPLRETVLDGRQWVVVAAVAVTGLLLALVTVNLAALFRARWLAARRGLAIRAALGAGRLRLAAELGAEALLLVGGGTVLAVALVRLVQPMLERQLPERLVELGGEATLSWIGLASTAAFALLVAALVVVPTAALLTRGRLIDTLRLDGGGGGLGRSSQRAARALVAVQVGLGLAMASATGLLLLDLRQRAHLELGYETDDLVVFEAPLTAQRYAEPATRTRFVSSFLERLQALPGVEAAAAINLFPSATSANFAQLEDLRSQSAGGSGTDQRLLVHHRLVSPSFAAALGLRLVEGRWLEPTDDASSRPVAVISRALAKRLAPDGASPLGQSLRDLRSGQPPVEVVGVVDDLHDFHASAGAWYLPLAQNAEDRSSRVLEFVVRAAAAAGPPGHRALRNALEGLDPDLAIQTLGSAEERYGETLLARRDAATATGFLAGCGLAMVALGLFALVVETVLRRRREFAIRLALGATPRRLVGGLVTDSLRLAAWGLLPGGIAALVVLRRLGEALESTGWANDPRPLLGALGVVTLSVLAAALLGGRRALRIEASSALGER